MDKEILMKIACDIYDQIKDRIKLTDDLYIINTNRLDDITVLAGNTTLSSSTMKVIRKSMDLVVTINNEIEDIDKNIIDLFYEAKKNS